MLFTVTRCDILSLFNICLHQSYVILLVRLRFSQYLHYWCTISAVELAESFQRKSNYATGHSLTLCSPSLILVSYWRKPKHITPTTWAIWMFGCEFCKTTRLTKQTISLTCIYENNWKGHDLMSNKKPICT